ncbi:MAG: hypothetical protein K5639_01930 [Eubacterium sp.]|nr:hypothetical protein [Eubacterium sp.]
MSKRSDSLKRIKKLDRITRQHSVSREYILDGEKKRHFPWGSVVAGILIFAVVAGVTFLWFNKKNTQSEPEKVVSTNVVQEPEVTPEPVKNEPEPTEEPEMESEPGIATFFQGPKSWKKKYDWSGYWGDLTIDGRRFGGFGCGLCCMANFYCSLTPYQCSPIDMYKFAKKVSSYPGGGAIDWPQIKKTMEAAGFVVDYGKRPKKYSKFKKLMKEAMASMVVVSSSYDNSFWKNTYGHYVTLFKYDPVTDMAFLGDSGKKHRNRRWISLKKVYKALKLSNSNHYMRMLSYDENRDTYKHKKISGKWVKPVYWTKGAKNS